MTSLIFLQNIAGFQQMPQQNAPAVPPQPPQALRSPRGESALPYGSPDKETNDEDKEFINNFNSGFDCFLS